MKRFIDQDYYTLLDISPKASFKEVRSAYDQAVNIYSADSIPTYSLFSKEERKLILSRLAEAYKTLTDSHLRTEYNIMLLEKGELSHEDIGVSFIDDSDIPKGRLMEVNTESLIQKEEEEENNHLFSNGNLSIFDSQASITGKDIKMIREGKEISLDEIFKETNIPKETLADIEEERFEKLPALVYVKGFLKAYAKILQLDTIEMVDGYVKRYLEWKNIYQK